MTRHYHNKVKQQMQALGKPRSKDAQTASSDAKTASGEHAVRQDHERTE